MPSNSRDIRRRIKSVKNIGQITKAMELVSAAKMRKAQAAATASRPYAKLSGELLVNLAGRTGEANHPLMNRMIEKPGISPTKILAILITSDRGLAGAFNANVINQAFGLIKNEGSKRFDFITVGKKGSGVIKRIKSQIIAAFPVKDKTITINDARPIVQIAREEFIKGTYEKVFIIFSEFVSTLVQKPNILQLLPFSTAVDAKEQEEFLFEPSADDVLETAINRAVEFRIVQSLVEAAASEHSARMVAMRNANEAAGDLIDDLSLSYNQARQAGITRELSEISAAKLAMEG